MGIQQVGEPEEIRPYKPLGTKWLWYWTYLHLPIGSLIGLIYSVVQPSVWGVFVVVPFAIFQLIIVYGLDRRRRWGWRLNWIIIVWESFYFILSNLTGEIGSFEFGVQFMIRFILIGLVWILPNYIYWKKRATLFN